MVDDKRTRPGFVARDVVERLEYAEQYGLPLFLLVYYDDDELRREFLDALTARLEAGGARRRLLQPGLEQAHGIEGGLGRTYSRLREAGPRTLSVIADFPRDPVGELDLDYLGYLDFHRDHIAYALLRFVVLLPTADAARFQSGATELWDFRHHTFWLERPEGARQPHAEDAAVADAAPVIVTPPAEIDDHVDRVRQLVGHTEAPLSRAYLFADLARWLLRHGAPGLALQAVRDSGAELAEPPPELAADLEASRRHALSITAAAAGASPARPPALARGG